MDNTEPRAVAVYGTLRRDMGGGWGIRSGTPIGLGKTDGAMYAHSGFPAVVPDEPGKVTVQVIGWDDEDDETWRQALSRMDRIEGVPTHYHRELVEVKMDDGTTLDAWIYFFTRHPTEVGMSVVPSGNWEDA